MEWFALVCLSPVVALLLLAAIPSAFIESRVSGTRRFVLTFLGWNLISTIAVSITLLASDSQVWNGMIPMFPEHGVSPSIYLDGVTCLMSLLVSATGLVVGRFSLRYLKGDSQEGRYYRWLGFTVGAVSLMVISGNLLLFFLAWVTTSFGLQQLLLHYGDRSHARRAAWTKFAISRLGDAFLILALMLVYQSYGTFQFSDLFAQARALTASELHLDHQAIGWLLVLGAITKSAQFPFHTWLPETLETPTPVSALMHAGIVNAGGYLLIRLSPLVVVSPSAMTALALIGTFTACFAAIVMMTQTSIKRSLAYSTIAQMGFMMLQCGLGAFSAAMLHILAHSLYKAYSFLNSGNALATASGHPAGRSRPRTSWKRYGFSLSAALVVTCLMFLVITTVLGWDLSKKQGAAVLLLVLCLGVNSWAIQLFSSDEPRGWLVGVAGVSLLLIAYLGSFHWVDLWIGDAMPEVAAHPQQLLLYTVIGSAFLLLFGLQTAIQLKLFPAALAALQVHAVNGFYVDSIFRRLGSDALKS